MFKNVILFAQFFTDGEENILIPCKICAYVPTSCLLEIITENVILTPFFPSDVIFYVTKEMRGRISYMYI